MLKILKRNFHILLIIISIVAIYKEVIFNGFIPLPVDTLVGAYFPWLSYKWGYITGVPVKNALLSDAFSHFYVLKNLSINLFKSGQWPFWNRFIFAGTPLFSTFHISAIFPGNLLLLLPNLWGWRAFIFFSSVFAAFSMYLYLKAWLTSPWARLSAAIVFAFAGPMTTWTEFGTAVWAAGFIPLLFYCLDKVFLKGKIKFIWLYSLLLTIMVTAGHVQLITYMVPLIFFYSLFLYSQSEHDRKLKLLFAVGVFSFLGFLMASIQLLPTYNLFKYSIRSEEHYSSQFNYGLVDFPQLIRLWLPDFFGHPTTANHWSNFIYHEYSSFIGTLTLPFISALVLKKYQTKLSNFFLIAFFVSLFLVVASPVTTLLFSLKLPLLTYSSASRLFFVTGLSSSVLLGAALEHLSKSLHILKPVRLFSVTFLLLAAIAIYLAPTAFRSIAIRNSLLPVSILLFVIVTSIPKLPKVTLLFFFFVILVFDLGRFFRKYNPFVPARLAFPQTPALEFLEKQSGIFRITREETNLLTPNTWVPYGLESIEGYEPLRPLAYGELFHLTKNDPLDSLVSRYSIQEDVNPKFLDALNVKYFLAKEKEDKKPSPSLAKLLSHDYKLVFQDDATQIYENPHVMPRTYFVQQVEFAESSSQEKAIMEDLNFDPTTTAVITEDLPVVTAPKISSSTITTYKDNSLEISASTDTSSLLVVASNFDKGWTATLDGQKVQIYKVNHSLIGLVVPAGDHQLKLSYSPPGFSTGVTLSLIAAIIWLISFLIF